MEGLDYLWAGWRAEFVSGAGTTEAINEATGTDRDSQAPGRAPSLPDPSCVFCRILASGARDEEVHIVWRHPGGRVIAILNAFPYTSGHLMAMPLRHVAELERLETAEAADLWETLTAGVVALKRAYSPGGINVGANLGRAAGAGVPGHFHMHVLPRWQGDTNFMSSVANARVLPEALDETDRKLRASWP